MGGILVVEPFARFTIVIGGKVCDGINLSDIAARATRSSGGRRAAYRL